MTSDDSSSARKDDTGFFQPYAEFSKVLRTWYIAFGAGALALLLTNSTVREAAASTGHMFDIALTILLGMAVQVLSAFVYKHAMWHLYCAELDPGHRKSRWYKLSNSISEAYFFDLAGDLITAGLFTWATVLFFGSFA